MTELLQTIETLVCPMCGCDRVYIKPVLYLLDAPYWAGHCCQHGCRHEDKLEAFIIKKIKKLVSTDISTSIN